MEIIGLTALGLTFAVFLFVVFIGACVLLWRKVRRPVPTRQATPLNPEDRNLDFLRRKYPDPAVASVPDLEELHLNYHLKRDREDKIASIRKGLDAGRTPPATPPNA